ncbi:hypothetical protein Q5752_002593 [Cryptotrichosporon argae]
MTSPAPEIPVGARVQVSAGVGVVRWTGSNPAFSAGKWVGVELDAPTGKNDGSVQGERYFACTAAHGVFVRPSQVKILEQPSRPLARLASSSSSRAASPQKPVATRTASAPSTAKPPAPTPVRRPSAAPTSTASPAVATAAPKLARQPSVAAPPARPLSSSVRPERTPTPSRAAAAAADRDADAHAMLPPPVPARVVSPDPPVAGARAVPSSPVARTTSPSARAVSLTTRAAPPGVRAASPTARAEPASFSALAPAAPVGLTSPDKDADAFAQRRELEELRIKVRLLESRRGEDQERLKALEAQAGEADALRAARVKLQAKTQEIQSALVEAQRLARDLQSENALLETRAAEALDQLEMATLDREVAEEKAEAADADAARLGEKIAELELEVAVLKEENAEYEKPIEQGVGVDRSSLAFVQLEKHNERLKEALIRLRDVSADTEKEQKAKIAELEKDLNTQEDLQAQLDLAEAKLGNAEAQVEDLKGQLDDALGAEDLLEQLTERNLQMSERIEEMRVAIEDLEALKELNDELEENHVETAKQLNEEIETISLQLRDERHRSAELDGVLFDMEATIGQFRDLVSRQQSEIDVLRTQQASQEQESASASKESQALLNLNLKLQSTAAKSQAKTVDLELKRLETAQLTEHLNIVQTYLPETYAATEADSTTALLFFHRLAAKVDILLSVLAHVHNLPQSLHAPASSAPEALVGVCELRGKLRHFGNLNRRFAGVMRRSAADAWGQLGRVVGEVVGVEARVDGWIGAVKADAFNEGDCARELASLIAQFDHLADVMFNRPELDVGEQQLSLAFSFDYDLDNFAAAVGFARQAVLSLAAEDGASAPDWMRIGVNGLTPDIEIDVGDSTLQDGVYLPVQRILEQVRSVKVSSGKLVAQVEEIVAASSAFTPDMTATLADLAASVSNAVDLAVQLAQRIGAHAASIRATKVPLRLADIDAFLTEVTSQSAAAGELAPWDVIGSFVSRLGAEMGAALPRIRNAAKAGLVISTDVPPPWLERVAAIRQAASRDVDAERKAARLAEELKDALREVKLRDQSLQESGVKVETLERRLEATRKQADLIVELENDVAKAQKQEKVYEEAIEQLQAEQDALEAENARLRKSSAGGAGGGGGTDGVRQANASSASASAIDSGLGLGGVGAGAAGVDAAHVADQLERVRTALRFVRRENALLRAKDLFGAVHALPPLPLADAHDVPELVPSSPTSGSDTDDLPSPTSSPIPPLSPHHPGPARVRARVPLDTARKMLWRDVVAYSVSPRIVDISNKGSGWSRRRTGAEGQVDGWARERRELERRVERLRQRLG